ncbi:N-acetyl-gamma-glutamyl-phosphate reductase [Aliidiomarina iranensis]|uniref:N-acetyl-gamma-glutamyl-phosphate reductase n=1 Tax=Aliidiomarina iranensis TaxID=1434071 RepID=UPI001F542797|nr:N-acetyl-gamma-glutamyl-phosphate reductase [Aliidiomarina iranensis]
MAEKPKAKKPREEKPEANKLKAIEHGAPSKIALCKQKGLQVAVFGASGYSGNELVSLLNKNAYFDVAFAFSSARSEAQAFSELAPQLAGTETLVIEPWQETYFPKVAAKCSAVFLALPHEASAELAARFVAAGVAVFDLSGAYRFASAEAFASAYGFSHPHPELLADAHYMLMEWLEASCKQNVDNHLLFSIPGCYPTAATLALKPLTEHHLLAANASPVITAVSGVSGAGRGLNARTSFCEVSLQAYGVLNHRHTPEIANNLQRTVVFTPQLGNYKRGIVATCVAQLAEQVNPADVYRAYEIAYASQPFVRIVGKPPAVDDVVNTPFCDIYIKVEGNQVVVISAIDNLIKGAAGQAMHAANFVFGLPLTAGFESSFAKKRPQVIKVGGALLQPENAESALLPLLSALAVSELPVVFVHGGGDIVDSMLKQAGLTAEKHAGQRISAAEHMDIIIGSLAGTTNKKLVQAAQQASLSSVGISLADGPLWQMQHNAQLGMVGQPAATGFSPQGKALLKTLLQNNFTPIVSSIGLTTDHKLCNVNADYAAAAIALALDADLLLLTDVPAILNGEKEKIGDISLSAAKALLQETFIQGGMKVKLEAAIFASEFSRRTTAIAGWADSSAVIAHLQGNPQGTRIIPE